MAPSNGTLSHEFPDPIGGGGDGKYLCLTICGYRREGMSEEDYRHHMTKVSAPMTKGTMAKHGIVRWTMIHNPKKTRALMSQLFDEHFVNVADFDCFSQVVFRDIKDYKRIREDPWYKEKLKGDHLNFADVKRSAMTIGWIEEFVRDGVPIDGFAASREVNAGAEAVAIISGTVLAGAMFNISAMVIPTLLESASKPQHLLDMWAVVYAYGFRMLPVLAIATSLLYVYAAWRKASAGRPWRVFMLAAVLTLSMLPFTWFVIAPTNNRLFAEQANGGMGWDEAVMLVKHWTMLHTARTLLPLTGAGVGMLATLGKKIF